MNIKIDMVRPECFVVRFDELDFTFKKIDMKWFVLKNKGTIVKMMARLSTLEECFNYLYFFEH